MSKRKPLKINYMDMKIPFNNFRIPKARSEQQKLVDRFEAEFGKDYRLNPWVDPCFDVNMKCQPIFVHNSLEEKIERIKKRAKLIHGLQKAIESNNERAIAMYNSLRDFPILPGSDNGWNITPGENKRNGVDPK